MTHRFRQVLLSKQDTKRICDSWSCHTQLSDFGWKDTELVGRDAKAFLFCDRCRDKLLARSRQQQEAQAAQAEAARQATAPRG